MHDINHIFKLTLMTTDLAKAQVNQPKVEIMLYQLEDTSCFNGE